MAKRSSAKLTVLTLATLLVTVGAIRSVSFHRIGDAALERSPAATLPIPLEVFPTPLWNENTSVLAARALANCRPSDEVKLSVSDLLHMLVLWGPAASMPTNDHGNELVIDCLLDDNRCRSLTGSEKPFLFRTKYGARFDTPSFFEPRSGNSIREAHVGQALSLLGMSGVPLSRELRLADGKTIPLRAVLDDLMANFSIHSELEWTITALALYIPPDDGWTNRYGHRFTFDDIATNFMARPIGDRSSACAGTHVLHTLALLWQVNRREKILSDATNRAIEHHFTRAANQLAGIQSIDGSWGSTWATDNLAQPRHPEFDRVWITGHHLDWMVRVPPNVRVRDEQLTQAIRFVCSQVVRTPNSTLLENCCQHFHGVGASALLIGVEPAGPDQLSSVKPKVPR